MAGELVVSVTSLVDRLRNLNELSDAEAEEMKGAWAALRRG